MNRNTCFFMLILAMVSVLEVVAFLLCIASEYKKTTRQDLKLDGRLCYLPTSPASQYGIAALICLLAAQFIASLLICSRFCSRKNKTRLKDHHRQAISSTLFVISWICCGATVVIVSAASSMNRVQVYGKGWLDGECYLVRDGIYIAAGVLILSSLGSTLASAIVAVRKS